MTDVDIEEREAPRKCVPNTTIPAISACRCLFRLCVFDLNPGENEQQSTAKVEDKPLICGANFAVPMPRAMLLGARNPGNRIENHYSYIQYILNTPRRPTIGKFVLDFVLVLFRLQPRHSHLLPLYNFAFAFPCFTLLAYPFFPGTTPAAGPPLPNIFLKSPTSSFGLSCAAK